MNHQKHVDGFKNTTELLKNFIKTQIESSDEQNRPFWEATADQLGLILDDKSSCNDLKTVIARVIYDPNTHEFLRYSVEDTDNVYVYVGDDPFAYCSYLLTKGYLLIGLAAYDYDKNNKPMKFVFRFARYY